MLREHHHDCVFPFSGGFPPFTPPRPISFCFKQNSYYIAVFQQCKFQFYLCGSSEVVCQIWKCPLDTKTKPIGKTESAGPHMIADERINIWWMLYKKNVCFIPSPNRFYSFKYGSYQSKREALVNETAFWRNPHCSRLSKIGWTMNFLNIGINFAPSREQSEHVGQKN